MGRLLDDYDRYKGWVNATKRCVPCGKRWVDVYHRWMKQEFHKMCPYCMRRSAEFWNVVPIRKDLK